MRKLLLILFFICFACQTPIENQTIEGFSEKVINTLINKDKEAFSKYMLTKDIAVELFKSLTLDWKKELETTRIPRNEQIASWFDRIVSQALEDGVELQNISYYGVERYEKEITETGIEVVAISVMILYNDSIYYIKLDDCIRGASGKFYMSDDPGWRGSNPPIL